jgi:hypothetical protein
MKRSRSFLLISITVLAGWQQSALCSEPVAGQAAPDQRRAELRLVLKAPRGPEAPSKDQLAKEVPNRHLSELERADLRQQVNQQLRDTKVVAP